MENFLCTKKYIYYNYSSSLTSEIGIYNKAIYHGGWDMAQ